jgi:hypothetical protein
MSVTPIVGWPGKPLPQPQTLNARSVSASLPVPDQFLRAQPAQTTRPAYQPPLHAMAPVTASSPATWRNDLKQMFHRNEAVIYALNLRTFGAADQNGDGRISSRLNEGGTFLSAISRLDELKALGVNTIHLLPINPTGRDKRFGEGGSLYAPSDYHQLNPQFDTPGNNTDVVQEARKFVEECHKRNIHVMVDIPSCASYDLMQDRPDLIARKPDGTPLTPTNWVDVVMFQNGQALQDYYEGFFDLMANKVGVDGFRADIARSRTPEFWRHFTAEYPDKAWLAETYTEEDQSPLPNLPRDRPETIMKSGFDSMYGQFHIFHSMPNAQEYLNYLLENRAMFLRASQNGGNDKSFIGSFLTHDDPALMEKGGVPISLLSSGLMATQPWTNPYILDGFTTGYTGDFDIFNYVPKHVGQHPEIGQFLQQMLKLRRDYAPVFTQGVFIPIPVKGEKNNQIIAFARQANGKTLLVIANKDVNARHHGTLQIPGLQPNQPLVNLAPEYGQPSDLIPRLGELNVDLGPARFFVFEINTPNLGVSLPAY